MSATVTFVDDVQSRMGKQLNITEEEEPQDSVSQFPFLNGYTHAIYGFQIKDGTSRDEATNTLRAAVNKVIDQVPWLGYQMVQVVGGPPGVFEPGPWPKDAAPNEIIRVQECDDQVDTFSSIFRGYAPISKLPGKLLTPWPSLPAAHSIEGPIPVMALKANYIKGGLLLNFSLHHMAVDATGILQVARLISLAMNGEVFPAAELEQANRDRRQVVPLIPRGEPVKDQNHIRRPPGWTPNPPVSPPKWCYFKVQFPALRALRQQGTAEGGMVSDNDILCAFAWQRLSVLRIARGVDPNIMCKFTRAVDGRTALGVPSSYMGHMIHHSSARLTIGEVANFSLPKVAQALRRELNSVNNAWTFRSYATFCAREPDKSKLAFGGLRDVNYDLGATSAQGGAMDETRGEEEKFGLLGPCKFIRRPEVAAIPGTITVTPAEGGALPLVVCLPEVDLEGLKKDVEWKRYTKYVG
ncbi:hypothetical protein M409DRAFT_16569 [Zasmidium cellare ATCC 36951]|uniref:Trichothecene 3-O-acetyltransferase-like N-terminal domain-containing protein n=1 Tax=Zasmidium cellare ATCC 36951 TaxID=1080233 RepID=A0A6A6D4N5_ZASCE|nr:uncharacterized protein M409DRAFT_16569 [Zasmidium cellare ATCC 36951]KAF2172606.1 hypothetical protein M409DRAFT_16569 [Zasmidium cellare ATCC 36951]